MPEKSRADKQGRSTSWKVNIRARRRSQVCLRDLLYQGFLTRDRTFHTERGILSLLTASCRLCALCWYKTNQNKMW